MNVDTGHPALVVLAGLDSGGLHVGDEVFLDGPKIDQLLIEVARKQQNGVLQLAFAIVQRALAEISDHHGGADGDGHDQERAAKDEPADRVALNETQGLQCSGTVCRHARRQG